MKNIGTATISVQELIAGTHNHWSMVFETGEYGIDDGGEIIIARRDVSDSGLPQFDDRDRENYVGVSGEVDASLQVYYQPDRYIRPWKGCICIKVYDGSLSPGDKIVIKYGGDRGPGYRIQTFTESEHIFKILVDSAGSGVFYPLVQSPTIQVTGGYIDRLELVAPSKTTCTIPFPVIIRALDSWGNIAERHSGEVEIEVEGERKSVYMKKGMARLDSICLKKEGIFTLIGQDVHKDITGFSNPIHCSTEPQLNIYWGDLHGQTKQTVGTGSLDEYFSFARDKAMMDFCSWQGNDFQVTDSLWKEVRKSVEIYHEPGSFITFLGYEWSGTTPVGGDHNIYFLGDEKKIYRSYSWQIGMKEETVKSDRCPISNLWDEFRGRKDIMAVPHIGGRYANLDFYDPEFIHLLEIHSHHGTFEWFFEDALKRGLKLGIISGSDDHTCRPGLSFPTRGTSRPLTSFDVKGGYTAIYASSLSRESIWQALKDRHCYATTGERILVHVKCEDSMMGDELEVRNPPKLLVQVVGTCDIDDLQIKRGLDTVYSLSEEMPSDESTVRIRWSGVRSRSRKKKTDWQGQLLVSHGRIKDYQPLAFDQPDEGITQISRQSLTWNSTTSGDIDGVDLELDYDESTEILFTSKPVTFSFKPIQLKEGRIVKEAGGVNQRVIIDLAPIQYKREVQLVFTDKDTPTGLHPYWVRVVQRDGHMAWTSPLFITRV